MATDNTKTSLKSDRRKRDRKDVFIARLRMLLNDPDITTVSWHPNGKAVMIDKRYIDDQVTKLFPECFGRDKFTSIRQNLGAHGFRSACKRQNVNDSVWKKYNHVLNSNKFLHIYEHPLFRREKPEHDKLIKRQPSQSKRHPVTPKQEEAEGPDAKEFHQHDQGTSISPGKAARLRNHVLKGRLFFPHGKGDGRSKCSGCSRISQMGGANLQGEGANLFFGQLFPQKLQEKESNFSFREKFGQIIGWRPIL